MNIEILRRLNERFKETPDKIELSRSEFDEIAKGFVGLHSRFTKACGDLNVTGTVVDKYIEAVQSDAMKELIEQYTVVDHLGKHHPTLPIEELAEKVLNVISSH